MKKITVLIIAALTLAACKHDLTADEQTKAQLGAVMFSQAAGADYVSCSGLDSDSDEYVTCTIKDRSTGAMKEIVCSYGSASGCKVKG